MPRRYNTPPRAVLLQHPLRKQILRHLAKNGPTNARTFRADGWPNALLLEARRLYVDGLIDIEKGYFGNYTNTTYSLTPVGRQITGYSS